MPAARPAVRVLAAAMAMIGMVSLTSCTNSKAALAKNPHTGTGSASAAANGIQQITVLTGPDLRFHPSTLTMHPGRVRIILKNQGNGSGGPPHDLEVSGLPGAYVPLTDSGAVGMVTFTASTPGHYHFVCTIHEQQGQTGTLIVEPEGSAESSGS